MFRLSPFLYKQFSLQSTRKFRTHIPGCTILCFQGLMENTQINLISCSRILCTWHPGYWIHLMSQLELLQWFKWCTSNGAFNRYTLAHSKSVKLIKGSNVLTDHWIMFEFWGFLFFHKWKMLSWSPIQLKWVRQIRNCVCAYVSACLTRKNLRLTVKVNDRLSLGRHLPLTWIGSLRLK